MINIPFKSKLQDIVDLDAKNDKFATLSKEEKRREIAFDSLKLIISEKIVGNPYGYWNTTLHNIKDKSDGSKDLCRRFHNLPKKQCMVCAKGAVMVSQIRLGNNIRPTIRGIDSGRKDILEGFSTHDMDKMESIYEGWSPKKHPYQPDTTQLLANIMCNVIANGKFKVKDTTDYLKLWNLEISECEVTF